MHEAFAKLLQAYGRTDMPLPAGPENPGFHFQAAARYTSLRRASALQRKKVLGGALPAVDGVPDTPSRLEPSRQKYAGQPYEEFQQVRARVRGKGRPVAAFLFDGARPQHPPEIKGVAKRDKPVSAEVELAKELNVMHAELIVSALHHAYKYYRGPTHLRCQLHIACLLADEHFGAGAFDLALRSYGEISQSRGLHNWSRLLYHVRVRATECADRL